MARGRLPGPGSFHMTHGVRGGKDRLARGLFRCTANQPPSADHGGARSSATPPRLRRDNGLPRRRPGKTPRPRNQKRGSALPLELHHAPRELAQSPFGIFARDADELSADLAIVGEARVEAQGGVAVLRALVSQRAQKGRGSGRARLLPPSRSRRRRPRRAGCEAAVARAQSAPDAAPARRPQTRKPRREGRRTGPDLARPESIGTGR